MTEHRIANDLLDDLFKLKPTNFPSLTAYLYAREKLVLDAFKIVCKIPKDLDGSEILDIEINIVQNRIIEILCSSKDLKEAKDKVNGYIYNT